MILASSLLPNCWEFSTRHPGILLVLLGVAGEVIFDWKEMRGRLAWAKRLSAIVLIAGLVLEFVEAAKSDRDVAAANLEAKQAGTNAAASYERAAIAEKEAGEANERVALAESNNLVLQKQLAIIKQWRTITPEQKQFFIESTKNTFKFPIRVRFGPNATEVQSFAYKIRDMLDAAGFVETNKDLAVAQWPPEMNLLYLGGEPKMLAVTLLNNLSTTSNVIDLKDAQISLHSFPAYATNPIVATVFVMTNTDEAQKAFVTSENGQPILHIPVPSKGAIKFMSFQQVQTAFNNIGITANWMAITNIPDGVCEVFINPK